MANHVRNILKMKGIASLPLFSEEGPLVFDFNKLIPMPEPLNPKAGSMKGIDAAAWYDWRMENWGTKCNGYDVDVLNEDWLAFLTAWLPPEKVIAALARRYPQTEIEHWWADENFGSRSGYAKYSQGEVEKTERFAAGSDDSYNTFDFCWGGPCLYRDKNGGWQRKDCSQCNGCDGGRLL